MELATLLPLAQVMPIAVGLLTVSFVLVIVRFLLGPSLADRIIAMEMFGMLAVVTVALYVLHYKQPALLPVAFLLALFGFLGTIAFARYLEDVGRKEYKEKNNDGNS